MRGCTSELARDLIKNCRFKVTTKKSNEQRCTCKRFCARCTAGGTKEVELTKPKAEKRSKYSGAGLKPRIIKNYVPVLPTTFTTHKVPILMHPELQKGSDKAPTAQKKLRNAGPSCATCEDGRRVEQQPRREEWCCVSRDHALLPNAEHYACPEWRYFTHVKTGGKTWTDTN